MKKQRVEGEEKEKEKRKGENKRRVKEEENKIDTRNKQRTSSIGNSIFRQ